MTEPDHLNRRALYAFQVGYLQQQIKSLLRKRDYDNFVKQFENASADFMQFFKTIESNESKER